MPKKRPPSLREELRDGTRIERNHRTGDDGLPAPYGSWYWVAYDPDRRPARKRVNLRTKDKSVAMVKANGLATEFAAGVYDPWKQSGPRDGVSFAEAAERFLAYQQRMGKSEATVDYDRGTLGRFEAGLPAGALLSHVERRHVEAFVHARKPVPKSKKGSVGGERKPKTKARILATLSHFSSWSRSNGLTRSDPTEGVSIPGVRTSGAVGRFEHVTVEEERSILDAIAESEARTGVSKQWVRDWIVFGTHTGLRPKEQRLLRWSAVRLDERQIQVGKGHSVKTPKSRRVVAVEGPALDVLRRRHEEWDGVDGPVFTGLRGGPVERRAIAKAIQRYAERAGLEKNVVPYSLRHSFGTRTVMAGIPIFVVAQEMGTSVAMIERHYAHYAPGGISAHLRALYGRG